MTNNATVLISENILQATADAIRNKGGTSGSIKPTDFAETIKAIAAGGLDTSDATATAAEIFQGKIAYAQGRKLTGTFTIDEELNTQDDLIAQIATALEGKAAGGEQATPEISVSSNGLITATAGIKSSTYQMAFQPAKTITPSATNQVAVSSGYYTGGNITVAGDSNLVAGNIKSGVSIFGVSGTLQTDSTSDGDYSEYEDTIINRTIVNYVNDRITRIGNHALESCSKLTTASFPACTNIGACAFQWCSKLTTINIPECTYIGNEAFANCLELPTASFSKCGYIAGSAFLSCSRLTSISFPVCSKIGSQAFAKCSSLTTINLPACEEILGTFAFAYCSKLTSINLPACSSIGANAFLQCINLISVNLPLCSIIASSAFASCNKLMNVNFPMCTKISYYAFRSCYNLSALQLGASSVCALSHSNAFSSTPFAGYSTYFSGTPHIYVPSSLITAYQSATNWVYFSSYFSSIESLKSNLITFTIDGSEYQAEEGMIWEEWVESGYNIGGFSSTAGFILKSLVRAIEPEAGMTQIVVDSDGNPVSHGDTIKLNHAYQTIISQY